MNYRKITIQTLFIIAILSLTIPLTLNLLVRNSILWSGPFELEYDYGSQEYAHPSYIVRTFQYSQDQYYQLVYTLKPNYRFRYVICTSDSTKYWSNPIDISEIFGEEVNGIPSKADLIQLSNGSLLLSALIGDIYESTIENYTLTYCMSDDEGGWNDHQELSNDIEDSFENVMGLRIFEQEGKIKFLVFGRYYEELELREKIKIYSSNNLDENKTVVVENEKILEETHYMNYDFCMASGGLYVTSKYVDESNDIKNRTLLSYSAQEWSETAIVRPEKNDWHDSALYLHEDKLHIAYTVYDDRSLYTTEMELINDNEEWILINHEKIAQIDDSWGFCVVEGTEDKQIILDEGLNHKLYINKFDSSRFLKYCFGTIGIIITAILPVYIWNRRKKEL